MLGHSLGIILEASFPERVTKPHNASGLMTQGAIVLSRGYWLQIQNYQGQIQNYQGHHLAAGGILPTLMLLKTLIIPEGQIVSPSLLCGSSFLNLFNFEANCYRVQYDQWILVTYFYIRSEGNWESDIDKP